jgi:hypothetical protein
MLIVRLVSEERAVQVKLAQKIGRFDLAKGAFHEALGLGGESTVRPVQSNRQHVH